MTDKQQILIISDRIADTSLALERALGAMFKDLYEIRHFKTESLLSEIKEVIARDQKRWLLSVFDDIFLEIESLSSRETESNKDTLIDQADQKYAEREAHLNSLISVKGAEIDKIEAEIDKIGTQRASLQEQGGKETAEATKIFEAQFKPLYDNLTKLKLERDNLRTECDKLLSEALATMEKLKNEGISHKNGTHAELLQSFLDAQAQVDTSTVEMSFELPPGLWEEYWLEAQEDRNRRIQELLRQFRATLSSAASSSLTVLSIKDQRQTILREFIKNIAVILIVDVDNLSTHGSISFLRKFWSRLLKYSIIPPQTLFLSLYTLQELIRRDNRHVALLAEDVEVVTVPFLMDSLKDTIQYQIMKPPSIDSTKSYLRQSADLAAAGIMEHRWKNIAAPYSLMIGASHTQELTRQQKYELLKRFYASPAGTEDGSWDEVEIYSALAGATNVRPDQQSIGSEAPERTLRDLMKNKKILLIDDKANAYGLTETIKALCSPHKLKVISGNWKDYNAFRSDKNLKQLLDSALLDELERYDLILLDLYLTGEDETIKEVYRNIKPPEDVTFGGLRLLQEFNSKPNFTVPVMLFTASTRHFNIEAAERTGNGIEGYFEKKGCYQDKSEATRYYRDFKEQLRQATVPEITLLRHIWKGIQQYRNSYNYNESIAARLEAIYYSLKAFIHRKEKPLLAGCAVAIGSIVEEQWNRSYYDYVYNPVTLNITLLKRSSPLPEETLYAFIAHQIRGSGAHPETTAVNMEDIFFAFLALLRALSCKVDDNLHAHDDCLSWILDNNAAKQLMSIIRKSVCPVKISLCKKYRDDSASCDSSSATDLSCAALLSLSHNVKRQALKNQIVFKYLFFILSMGKAGYTIPNLFLDLIKHRLTCNGFFCPPLKMDQDGEYYWSGQERPDGTIESALGSLDYTMYQHEKQDGEFVLFHPTPRYLRG